MTKYIPWRSSLLVTCGLMALASPAQAQEQAQPPAQAADAQAPEEGLTDIIVTAQRREENLQNVPISVTAISGDDLAQRGVVSAQDLQGQLPAVQFLPIDNLFVNVRGIGTFNLQPGVDSAVAYTVDGNFVAHPAQLPTILLDMARVEALRGPQGTLFGRNANAGAINFVTARPEHEFSAYGSLGVGNYSLFRSEAMVNLPVTDGFALRAAFGSESHNPYLDDGHNDGNQIAARIRALIEPTSNLTLLLTADYMKRHSNNNGVTPCPPNATEAACAGVPWRPFAGLANANPDDFSRTEGRGVYGQLDWGIGEFANLTYIASYRDVDSSSLTTPTLPGYGLTDHNRLFTQELRLASRSGSPFQWVAGLYYSRERFNQLIEYNWDALPNVDGVISFFTVDYYRAVSKAAFAQVTVPLGQSIRLIGGLRYTEEEKVQRGTANAYGGTFANPVLLTAPTGGDFSTNRLTWRAGVEADVGPHSLLYATVSTGFKSGGVNQVDPTLGLPTTYEPERITAYALGSKNRFLQGRLQLNAEAFYYDYSGFQTIQASFQPSGLLFFLTVNSQRARFYGGELEGTFLLTPHDRFDVNVALLDAKLTRFVLPGVDYSGNRAANAPGHTIDIAYEHTFELGGGAELTARAQTQFVGGFYVTSANEDGAYQSSYMQSSANLSFQSANRRWSVSAWIRNIENNGVIYNINPPGTQAETVAYPLPPRTFGLTVRVGI